MKRDSKYKFAKLLLLSSFSNVTAAQLEEVVVTAQKRAENVQDIPLAISAFGSDRLEKSGFDSISDLAMMSPSMQMGTFGPIAFVAMRGIGTENTTAGGDPGVALHYDGVYIGRPVGAIFAAFDSERVEILRGPQGTLYGRNATGGSINYVTKKPTDELGGEVDVTVGDYKWARVRGALNVPLTDSARARVVVFNEDRDGFTRNIVTGRDGNDADDFGVRGHLALDLGDSASLLISATHIESKGVGSKPELREAFPGTTTRPVGAIGGPPGFAFDPMGPAGGIPAYNTYVDAQGNVAVNDLKPFENSKDFLESQDNDFSLVSANLEWEFGNLTFRSITGYGENSYESLQDEDFSSLDLAGFVIEEESEQISQEFQLLSDAGGNWQWILGAFYFNEDAFRRTSFYRSRYDVFASQFGVPSGFDVGGDVETTSLAVFGQTTYDLSDDLSLTLGLRYSDDEKEGVNRGFLFAGAPYEAEVGESWDEFTYRVALDWRFSDDVMLYGSVSTGYKSGGINQVAGPAANAIYDPELVDALEVGLKSTWLDGRLQLNAALYNNEYDDLQFQVFTILGISAFNAEGATVRGLELEANAAITNTLVVDLSLGVTDSEFDDQLIEIAQGTFADIGGNQVQRTPDLTYAIGLTKDWNLASGASIQLRIEHSFTDEIFYSALNGVAGDGEAGGSDLAEDYTNTNLRIFYHSADDRWTFELAATNLTDEVQEGNVFRGIGFLDIPGGGGPEEVTYNSPRLISGRIAYRF